MNTIRQIAVLFLFSLIPLFSFGQTYEKWWKEVETLQQKDLPKSVMEILDKIYDRAKAEKNLPQMMKAWMMKADCRGRIVPDSMETDRKYLEEWAEKETDTVGRAVLNSLAGSELSERGKEEDIDRAIGFFRLSLLDKEILGNTPATDFVPMTKAGELSERYLGNSMYDLLVREAIRGLLRPWNWGRQEKIQEEIVRMYDELLAFYGDRNREATLITLLAKAEWQAQGTVGMRFRLTDEEYGQWLDTWMEEYKDLDVCAHVYLRRSMLYERKNHYAKAHEIATEGLRRFPKSDAAAALTGLVKRIETPELNVNIPFIYPEHEVEVHVSYKNLTAVKADLYRLNLKPVSPVLRKGEYDEAFVRKYGEKVGTQFWTLNPTDDYRQTDTLLHYRMPEPGIYLLELIPDQRTDHAVYSVLHVSPYQCVALPVHGRYYELTALDKRSGQPIPGAEIVTYREKDDGYEAVEVYATDERGSVTVKVPNRSLLWCNVRTPENDFMAIGMLSVYRDWREEKGEKWENRVSFFTDRSLYRPGQRVHVSGVVYRQCGDSLQVVESGKSELVLRLHGKELAKTEVCTDAWGTFSAELVLPQRLLPGEVEISAYGKSEYVKVEEYKRPTFDVTFVPYGKAYAIGDSIRIEGKALTFSGAPVRKAAVDFEVVRAQRWFWMPSGRERDKIQTGRIETGEDGRFVLNICLSRPDTEPEEADMRMYYTYTVTARVTGGAGETQAGTLVLPVGNCSLGLQIEGLHEKMVREEEQSIVFHALNLRGMPVVTEVMYRVFAAGEKTDTLYEGKVRSQETFVPQEIWKLPSGSYRMEVSARDDRGRECKAEQHFVLFSRTDTRPPVETVEWFYQEKNGWDESGPVNLYVGSSEDSVYLFVDVYTAEKRIETRRIGLSNEIVKLTYPFCPAYENGITVHLAFLRKGQWYNRQVNLVCPEPDKQLQLKWETFRNRLQPGEREEWRLKILDKEGHPANANLMAVLYDTSLDRLYAHHWYFNLSFHRFTPYWNSSVLWHGQQVSMYCPFPYRYAGSGLRIDEWGDYSRLWRPQYDREETLLAAENGVLARPAASRNAVELKYMASKHQAGIADVVFEEEMIPITEQEEPTEADPAEAPIDLPLRENFAETAFFYPQLRTDSAGQVSMVFTLPDALTTWKWMGFAHTKAMDYGLMTDTVVASKPFMVQPNLPRFMRVGDRASMAASLVNLSAEEVKGTACLQLIDPMTEKVVYSGKKKFHIGKGETGITCFDYEVSGEYKVLVCKIVAEAGNHTDGEQHYIPVLADKQWVTETIPVQMEGEDTVSVDTKPFFNGKSPTATDKRLTVELTAHPDWYVVQALPVLGNPASDDAISWSTAYYANCLSAYIVKANPRIGKVLESWKVSGKKEEYERSGMERNSDLKDLLTEESPWLVEALQETEQKQKIAGLFDRNGLENSMRTAIGRLENLQHEDGSWSWYKGMEGNLYVTTTVAVTMARLRAMTGQLDKAAESMYERAVGYLRKQVEKDYERMQKLEKKGQIQVMPREGTLAFLYMNALDAEKVSLPEQRITAYLLERLEHYSADDMFEKSVIALIMQAGGKKKKAEELIQSVKEYTVYTRDMGRYFDTRKAAYSWNDYRIPTQTVAMEAIRKIAPDVRMENEMKYWLLRQKQVQVWSTPIATADAVYAFLCMGNRHLEETGGMRATVGEIVCRTPQDALGYTRCTLEGTQAETERIVLEKTGKGIGWGTVYVQYTEQMDRLQEVKGSGLSVKREYRMDGKTVDGKTRLNPGDKLTVRLIVSADRDMDFVRIKDERAACMEPAEQLSGYHHTGGLGYYRVNRDAATEFFIDRMQKGTYILEYEVYTDRSGTYQAGVASVQSVYAPEFAAHTGGEKLTVSFCGD